MTQTEIAYQNILTVVALYQAEHDLTQEDRDMLITSLHILGEGAGISKEKITAIALEVWDSAKQMKSAEEN